jgi:predicted MPP superfamily phosphohydrolase
VNESTLDYKGLRIVQISDIHSGSFDNPSAVMEGIESIGPEKPDLILFTGDLVNIRSSEIMPYLNVFGNIKAPLGVYSILGNHDYGDYLTWPSENEKHSDFMQLQAFHKAMGWQLLMNENRILSWNDKKIALIGVENWSAIARFPRHGDIKKAMTGLEDTVIPLKIMMSHDPSHWDAEIRPGYPDVFLTLSGHTHGMQFGVEIPGFKWSPAQYMYKQWAGLYRENAQYLYVNRGFGFIGYEGRLGILPEIAVLDFV